MDHRDAYDFGADFLGGQAAGARRYHTATAVSRRLIEGCIRSS